MVARPLVLLLAASCNAVLGNGDFSGPVPGEAGIGCAGGLATLTGTVYAPNGTLPIYNAVVYVPTAQLADIADGASGPICISGAPATTTRSDTHGHFTLENVPSGKDVRLVVQIGKWRREVTVPSVPACMTTPVDPGLTHLPSDSSQGHLPRIAVATGSGDTLECIMRDLGIGDAEITSGQGSTGRVRLYDNGGADVFDTSGAMFDRFDAVRVASAATPYDAILVACTGVPGPLTPPSPSGSQALFNFTNRGGWLWLTHGNFSWLEIGPAPWDTLGNFTDATSITQPRTVLVDGSTQHGKDLADWAVAAGVSTEAGKLQLPYTRSSCTSANSPAQRVLYLDPEGTGVQMFTWQAAMGGALVFSDVHVSGPAPTGGIPDRYPSECSPSLTVPTQEKVIMLEMFDVATCVP